MLRIADLSFGKSSLDCSYEFEYRGKHFEVQRFGANFSMPYFRDLMVTLRNQVDAFAVSGFPPIMQLGGQSFVHRQYLEIMGQPSSIPICDGARVRELANVNGVATLVEQKQFHPERGVFFPMALMNLEVVYHLSNRYAKHLRFGDWYSTMGLPILAKPSNTLAGVTKVLLHFLTQREIGKITPMAKSRFKKASRVVLTSNLRPLQYIFGDIGLLGLFDHDLEFIRGKDVIVPYTHPALLDKLGKYSPRSILNIFPKEFQLSPFMHHAVLDATLRLALDRTAPLSLEDWEKLMSLGTSIKAETRKFVVQSRPSIQSQVTSKLQSARNRMQKSAPPDFAFVVHALSRTDLERLGPLRTMKYLPMEWRTGIESLVAKTPGFTYGRITGIVSRKNNREVNGIIYGLLATPKMMLQEDPEVTYKKIESLCHHAAGLGVKLMGLGAFTKVVGDSGATINRNSPIPVTTGNSLSASATLWAVHEVVQKMNLIGPRTDDGLLDGTAMVIGATGSIGKVSAKLISLVFKRVCIVAPRQERLDELKREIAKISPRCEVITSTNSNDWAHETDVLITATSAFDQKIIDVERLKPGCVVCDCSRPLDFSIEDSLKRPDILIIESGEVILPGPVKITCDLALPDNCVYACLGETAVLAMEELHQPFTLGRDLDWQKVKQIYKLSLEHGVKLATIRGHAGIISDREIAITRQLALEALKRPR